MCFIGGFHGVEKAVCVADKFLREDQWYWLKLQRVLFSKYFTFISSEE